MALNSFPHETSRVHGQALCSDVHNWPVRVCLNIDPRQFEEYKLYVPTGLYTISSGVFCCGPCPVEAIRAGDMSVLYDAAFIFAEVNADIVYWEKNGPYEYKVCANNGRYTNR